jgi:hypothetical protein
MAFTTNIKTWYQITLSYRPIIKDFHTPSPIPHTKRHKSCNCTYSTEIFRDSFTPVPIHTLSLPARSRTSFINCFPSSLPAYSSQNLSIEWNLVDVGNITFVITTDTNECAALAVHGMDRRDKCSFTLNNHRNNTILYTYFVGCHAVVRKCRACSKSIYTNSSLHEINARYKKQKNRRTTFSSDEKLDVIRRIGKTERIVDIT